MSLVRYSLGVSVEEGRLHLVYLRAAWGGREVVAAASIRMPDTSEAEGSFFQEVHKFLLKNRVRTADVITLGINRRELIFRQIDTPPLRDRDLPELVEFECDRHLPGKKEEFLVGYQHQGRLKNGGHQLLLGAAKRSTLERQLSLLRKANLSPFSFQPAPVALAAAFTQAVPVSSPVLLLSVGRSFFGTDVLRGGKLVYSRFFHSGGPEGKNSFNDTGGPEAAGRLAEAVSEKLRQPLFVQSLPGEKLPPLWLCGSGPYKEILVERLQRDLGVPVQVFSPEVQVRGSGAPPMDASEYSVPLGLALLGLAGAREGLELSQEREENLREQPRFRLTAALAVLLFCLVGVYFFGLRLRQRQHLARIDKEVQVLKVKAAAVKEINREVQEKNSRLRFLAGSIPGRTRQSDLLKELTGLVPDDSYLSEYLFRDGKIVITGLAPSASRLLPLLAASPLIERAEFSAPIVSRGETREKFKITMYLEGGGN